MSDDLPEVKSLFQILITDDEAATLAGTAFEDFSKALRGLYPRADYRLLGDRDLRKILRERFSSDVLAAYERLTPYAYKADLARYCLMYEFGGLYSDLANEFVKPLRVRPRAEVAIFAAAGSGPWALANQLIYAVPRRREFKLAIKLIVRNCASRYYGAGSTEPTGPMLYGRCFAMCSDVPAYSLGHWGPVVPIKPGQTKAYTDYAGDLFAVWSKRTPGQSAEYGLKGTNDYNQLWAQRRVYGETAIRLPLAGFSHTHAELTESGLRLEAFAGCQVWGPYVALKRGRYLARLRFTPAPGAGAVVDVCSGHGSRLHAAVATGAPEVVTLPFELEAHADLVELRLHNDGRFAATLMDAEFELLA